MFICTINRSASLKLVGTGTYGIDDIKLENKYLKVVVSPDKGGRIISLVDKVTGREYAQWKNGNGGILHLMKLSEGYPGEMRDADFKYDVVSTHPERVSVRLFYKSVAGTTSGIEFSKKFTLYENQPCLYIKINAQNKGFITRKFGVRLHNWMTMGEKWDNQVFKCLAPTDHGVKEIQDKLTNKFLDNVVSGWLAQVDRGKRQGIVSIFNEDDMGKSLFYIPSGSDKGNTMEWTCREISLETGDSWETDIRFIPFHNLANITYASPDELFFVKTSDNRISIKIYSIKNRKITISPVVDKQRLPRKTVSLQTGKISDVEINAPNPAGKTITFNVSGHGIRYTFQVLVPPLTDTMVLERREKRPPVISKGNISKCVITKKPNRPFAQRKKQIKALVLSTWRFDNSAWTEDFPEIRKLSSRTRRSYEWLFCRITYTQRWAFRERDKFRYFLKNNPRFSIDTAFDDNYTDYLSHLYDYDVLIINDFPAEALVPYLKEIKEYVSQGHGLIFWGGYCAFGGRGKDYGNYKQIEELLPVKLTRVPDWINQTKFATGKDGWGHGCERNTNCPVCGKEVSRFGPVLNIQPSMNWLKNGNPIQSVKRDHPVIKNIHLNSLSPSYHQVALKEDVDLIVVANGEPVIVAAESGEGRVLAVTISDPRRLYYWKYTRRLLKNMLEWVCKVPISSDKHKISSEYVRDLDISPKKNTSQLQINCKHKRHYLRGETIVPEIYVGALNKNSLPDKINASLVDEHSRTVISKTEKYVQKNVYRLPLDSSNLAFGRYRYVVATFSEEGKQIETVSTRIFIDSAGNIDFPVSIYAVMPAPRAYLNSYMSMAMIDRLSKDYNLGFACNAGRRGAHEGDIIDYCLSKGFYLMQFPVRCYLYMKRAKDGLRDPEALKKITKIVSADIKAYEKYPAIYGTQFDDEGKGFSKTGYDKKIFKEKYGIPMPADPTTLKERLDLANYYIQSASIVWKTAADTARKIRPELKQTILQTVIHPASVGGWLWENFKGLDVALIDLYPSSLNEIGQDFFYFNLLRCIGKKQNIPGWVILGEYREDFDTMKMQYWLLLGSGLEGYGWYYTGYSTNSGVYRKEWDLISPYQKVALNYGPLFARWNKPDSKIGVFHSKAVLSYTGNGPVEKRKKELWAHTKNYSQTLEGIFKTLYDRDLYADVFTETDILDNSIDKYEVLIIAGVDAIEKNIQEKLAEFGKRKPVYVDDKTTVKILNSRTLDADDLCEKIQPLIKTSGQNIYGELLDAEGMKYVVVYNHNRADEGTEIKIRDPEIKTIYDMLQHKKVSFKKNDRDTISFKTSLKRTDGKIFALLTSDIQSISLNVPSVSRPGNKTAIKIRLLTLQPIKGTTPVRVTVINPDEEETGYSRTTVLGNGFIAFNIPFAVNDMPGKWLIKVEDMITGKKTQAYLELKGQEQN